LTSREFEKKIVWPIKIRYRLDWFNFFFFFWKWRK
jgi:hypothetical protein